MNKEKLAPKVTSEKLLSFSFSIEPCTLYCKILNENIQRCRSDNQLKFQQQNSQNFLAQIFFKVVARELPCMMWFE